MMQRHPNAVAQGVCWFGDDVYAKDDLRALAHWTQILPFMMLFHVCEGHDMHAVMQVSSFAQLLKAPLLLKGMIL